MDKTITIENINSYQDKFLPVTKKEKFMESNTTYWLRVDLGKNFPSGRFICGYGDADFTEHTFTESQALDRFVMQGIHHLEFSYDKTRDSQVYYFRLQLGQYKKPFRFISIVTPQSFYTQIDKRYWMTIILSILIGLIFMAGLYNGAMYYYNRDRSFLDYAFMQFFISLSLFTMMGIFEFTDFIFARNFAFYEFLGILALLFATRFAQSFLDTKRYLPRLDKVLNFIVVILLVDMLFTPYYGYSFVVEYNLIPFFASIFVIGAYLRLKQGFKAVTFYFLGGFALVGSLFLEAFALEAFWVNPFYIGSAMEAMLFSLALSYKVKMIADEKEQQKELMIHQSKLASMGEMIGNIAHQWRQPLTYLSYSFMNLKEAQKQGALSNEYLSKKVDDATKQLEFMSQTIDDFRDFYAPNKSKELFSLSEATKETLELMRNSLTQADIEVMIEVKEESRIENYKNEYKQVLVNLLTNAKEALVHRAVDSPQIIIKIDTDSVTIHDNAGGIEPAVLKRIFEPYFTTKQGNSGIGLYMSKMITERNMGGRLLAANDEVGAVFRMIF